MRKITIELNVDNAAFQNDDGDVNNGAVALEVRRISERIAVGAYAGRVIDVNGNTVGKYSTEDK